MKTVCSPGYHHNRFVATRALRHRMHGYRVYGHFNRTCLSSHSHNGLMETAALGHTHE